MNITDRNVGRDNKQLQVISNAVNNWLSTPNKDPKKIRAVEKIPPQKTISFRKALNYDPEYATRNNLKDRSSYHDDLINSLNIQSQGVKDDNHTLLTSNAAASGTFTGQRTIEKVKPKNQVSGITDKNLMSHLIVPSSLVSAVTPKNNIKPMNLYRKADSTPMPPIITPVTSSKEKMITII